jgi:hypothetical protein
MDSVVSAPGEAILEQLRRMTLVLEELAGDWTLFERLPPDERDRSRARTSQTAQYAGSGPGTGAPTR